MKKTICVLLAASALCAAPRAGRAQGAQTNDGRVIVALKLKHVAPSTMARWLSTLQSFDRTATQLKPAEPGPTEGEPIGGEPLADTMLPNDSGGELWARTTPAREPRLRQLAAALDVEPERVQLEVQAARVATSDLPTLLADVPHASDPRSTVLILGSASPRGQNAGRALQKLVADNRAALMLHQTFEAGGRKRYTLATEEPPDAANGLRCEITPTINDGGTVNLKLLATGGAQNPEERRAFTIFMAHDGDTTALVLRDADAASPQATIVLISARLPRPGTAG